MDTASYQFVLFGLIAALISNFSRSSIWRSIVLMAASVLLLALLARNPITLLPFLGFLLLGYAVLVLLQRGFTRILTWGVVAVVLAYIWLKKYTFLPEASFLRAPYFSLGLSYIFFRILHLLIETGEGVDACRISFSAYMLYLLNFTTFVSGPIQRYDQFAADQFASEPIPLGPRVIGKQLERVVRGFFKVNVLATLFDMLRASGLKQLSYASSSPAKLSAALMLAIVYPLFLYSNFSGYIDIVIALARIMRLRLPENFDRPFAATSVLDFWNRWHITLSNWLKSYVFNPLLLFLMRRFPSPAITPFLGVISFFVTFFLIGIWHGRTSEFIVFGVLTGGGMSLNKLWQIALTHSMGRREYKALSQNSIYEAFSRGLNYAWFSFTLLWFESSWKQIDSLFGTLKTVEWLGVWLTVWLSATLVLAFWEWLRAVLLSLKTTEGSVLTSRYARVVYASALGLAAVIFTVLLNQPAPAIVYRAF